MDEKMFGFMLNSARATDVCMDGVKVAMDCLKKQAKINKRQKRTNFILVMLTMTCISNVSDAIKIVRKQTVKIKELEAKLGGEGSTKKGE